MRTRGVREDGIGGNGYWSRPVAIDVFCRLILSSSLIRFISVSAKLIGDFSINRQKRSDLLAALPLLELFSFAAI
jgi:hypothetical protein